MHHAQPNPLRRSSRSSADVGTPRCRQVAARILARGMKVGVAKEIAPGERRVALVPDAAARLEPSGVELIVEVGRRRRRRRFSTRPTSRPVRRVVPDAAALYAEADLVARCRSPRRRRSSCCVRARRSSACLQPLVNEELVRAIAARGATAFSMDAIPRISRAQSMDVLSSQATVAGYKAALLAAEHAAKFFPMLTTAAGTIPPAKVLVLGAGVAGLQAIATARRLGAVVSAFDTRPVVKEQVESLGASFLEIAVSGERDLRRLRYAAHRGAAPSRAGADLDPRGAVGRRHHDRCDPGKEGAGAHHRRRRCARCDRDR